MQKEDVQLILSDLSLGVIAINEQREVIDMNDGARKLLDFDK